MNCPVCGAEIVVIDWEGATKRLEVCGDHYRLTRDKPKLENEMDGL